MTNLEFDANTVMEQIHMVESRHMQMGALCSYLLEYPDMIIIHPTQENGRVCVQLY